MKNRTVVTTSWDDGHPSDLRLAELLRRHGISATFYVPRASQLPTLEAKSIRDIAADFEVGAHTLEHLRLTQLSRKAAQLQIEGSKKWLEQVLGIECRSFCPPGGKFKPHHLRMACEAGIRIWRTVEAVSLEKPVHREGLEVLPTTVHAFPWSTWRMSRNLIKRWKLARCFRVWRDYRTARWIEVARTELNRAIAIGGLFHLWGHSWELDEMNLWPELEDLLIEIGERIRANQCISLSNCATVDFFREINANGVAAVPNLIASGRG